jgi:hypothetical protein
MIGDHFSISTSEEPERLRRMRGRAREPSAGRRLR